MPSTAITTREALITETATIIATATITALGGRRVTIITARIARITTTVKIIITIVGTAITTGMDTGREIIMGEGMITTMAGKGPHSNTRASRRADITTDSRAWSNRGRPTRNPAGSSSVMCRSKGNEESTLRPYTPNSHIDGICSALLPRCATTGRRSLHRKWADKTGARRLIAAKPRLHKFHRQTGVHAFCRQEQRFPVDAGQ